MIHIWRLILLIKQQSLCILQYLIVLMSIIFNLHLLLLNLTFIDFVIISLNQFFRLNSIDFFPVNIFPLFPIIILQIQSSKQLILLIIDPFIV